METQTSPQRESARNAYSLAKNPYAWPGGYPMYGIMEDGDSMCHECARSERANIYDAAERDGWRMVAVGVNWEDDHLICCNCGNKIESAYGEDN